MFLKPPIKFSYENFGTKLHQSSIQTLVNSKKTNSIKTLINIFQHLYEVSGNSIKHLIKLQKRTFELCIKIQQNFIELHRSSNELPNEPPRKLYTSFHG